MLQRPLKTLRRLRRQCRGNATLIVAMGMPALIGGTGFAVDTAQWYMWKRELQHSVDQAAIAGAWALAQDDESGTYETRALQEFNSNQQVTDEFDSLPTVLLASWAGGDDNSVIVSATASKKLPFSSFLTGKGVVIRATAQASFAEGANFHACLTSIAEDGTGTSIGGNATVKAKCGLAALSCDEDEPAIEIDSNATVETDSIVACGKVDVPEENQDVVTEDVESLRDLFKDVVPPTKEPERTYQCVDTGKGKDKVTLATVAEGTYKGGITVKCRTNFTGGIYVIDGGTLDLTANYNVTGTGVLFVLKNGASIKLGGSGNDNKVNLTPISASYFIGGEYEDQADTLAGMLVIEDRENDIGTNNTHIINGNSNSLIEGIIYLPANTVRVNGTADIASQCLQISAYRIKILGGANLETLCPTDAAMSVGSSLAKVRLVA